MIIIFGDFCQFCDKNGFFLKEQCYDTMFSWISRVFKITTSAPGTAWLAIESLPVISWHESVFNVFPIFEDF
jgi:hypothetical protein